MKKRRKPTPVAAPTPELIKLDIACGKNKTAGYTGIDIVALPGVDVVHDLTTYPWPFEAGSVGQIVCNHYVEHVEDAIAFFEELYRLLAPGGTAILRAPYYTSIRAVQDPTHRRMISERLLLYFNKANRAELGMDHYPITCDFDYSYAYVFYPGNPWVTKSQEARDFAIKHYWNVVEDIEITLTRR
jgi:SAM-dependent methyltransferase